MILPGNMALMLIATDEIVPGLNDLAHNPCMVINIEPFDDDDTGIVDRVLVINRDGRLLWVPADICKFLLTAIQVTPAMPLVPRGEMKNIIDIGRLKS